MVPQNPEWRAAFRVTVTLFCKDIAPLSVAHRSWALSPRFSDNCICLLLQAPLLSRWAIFNGLFDHLVNLFGCEKNNGLDLDRPAGVGY